MIRVLGSTTDGFWEEVGKLNGREISVDRQIAS